MSAAESSDLASRRGAVIAEERGQARAFQDAFDEAAVSKWFDDRSIDFAHVSLGITVPNSFAPAHLDHGGTAHSSIGEDTRREFAMRNGRTS